MKRILPIALVVAIFAAAGWAAWTHFFDHDEIEHLHAAWMVGQGLVPYADFVETHHPPYWYAMAPVVGAFSVPHHAVFAARLINIALLILFALVLMRIVRRLYPGVDARWPVLLLLASFMFLHNSLEARPDPLMNLLFYAGLLNWIVYLEDSRLPRAAAAGLLFGLSACALQKAIVVLALVGLASIILVLLHMRDRRRTRSILAGTLLAVFVAAIPVAALFGWMASVGLWDDFIFWNYTYNRFFYLHADVPAAFSVLTPLLHSFLQNAVLWIFGAAGFGIAIHNIWRGGRTLSPESDAKIVAAAVAVGYAIFLARTDMPLAQYFIVFMPLLALFSAEVFRRFGEGRPLAASRIAVALMVAELAVLFAIFQKNAMQREFHRYILDRTAPDDVVAIAPPENPIYRGDTGFFWMNGTLIADVYGRLCGIRGCENNKIELESRRWRENPPVYVYLDPAEPATHPCLWSVSRGQYRETGMPNFFIRRGDAGKTP